MPYLPVADKKTYDLPAAEFAGGHAGLRKR